jgi:hypothetical protein
MVRTTLTDLLRESVIISGLLSLAICGCLCYVVACGKPIPQELFSLCVVVFAFFFDAKKAASVDKTVATLGSTARPTGVVTNGEQQADR